MFNIHEDAKKYEEYVIGLRQEFHRHPELSDQEVWTSGRICEELDKMGIPYTRVAGTNVVGLIDTGRPGKTIAFRGDIDALPVHEEANVPFKSEIDGLMHACGHDSHAAMVLPASSTTTRMSCPAKSMSASRRVRKWASAPGTSWST